MIAFLKDFSRQLDECNNLEQIFMLVQEAVKKSIQIRRDNMQISLMNLPSFIGGFHPLGSNVIGVNKGLLQAVLEICGKKTAKSFLFHVLLHEYLHSLGLVDEGRTDALAYQISENLLGENHPSTLIARYGLASAFHIKDKEKEKETKIEITFYG